MLESAPPHSLTRSPAARTPRVLIRVASGADGPAIERMFARCSPGTIRARFHGTVGRPPPAYLDEIIRGHPDHLAVVAVCGDDVVALGSLCRYRPTAAELALLVADAWQGDLGWRLAVALLEEPFAGCLTSVSAEIMVGNAAALGSIRKVVGSVNGTAGIRREDGVVCVTLDLIPGSGGTPAEGGRP